MIPKLKWMTCAAIGEPSSMARVKIISRPNAAVE